MSCHMAVKTISMDSHMFCSTFSRYSSLTGELLKSLGASGKQGASGDDTGCRRWAEETDRGSVAGERSA